MVCYSKRIKLSSCTTQICPKESGLVSHSSRKKENKNQVKKFLKHKYKLLIMSLSVISRFGQFTKYSTTSRHVFSRSPAILNCKFLSTEAAPLPDTGKANIYSEKIVKIVDQIGQLNLLEVADLNKLLKVIEKCSIQYMGLEKRAGPEIWDPLNLT